MEGGRQFEKFWFELSGKECSVVLFDTVRELRMLQSHKSVNDSEWYKLYSNHNISSFSIDKYSSLSANAGISFNVVQSIVDSLSAKIGKNKPRITFLTDDGNWGMHLKAQKLEKFIDSEFYSSKAYDVVPRALKVSCVFGSGLVKAFERDGKPVVERVLPHEVLVDDRECMVGDPDNKYQETYVSKFVLKKLYPKFEKEIEVASRDNRYFDPNRVSGFYPHHMVQVIEAWHLRSSEGADDGRHVISIIGCNLLEEDCEFNYFPFCKIDFTDRIIGYWGMGVPELLRGIQLNINRLLNRITKSIDIGSVHRVWLEYSSKVVATSIDNEVGGVHHYRGTPPIFSTPSVVPPEVFNQLDRLYNRAYELIGMSQLSASSQKPSGLNAMVAIREYHDIETERFSMVQTSYDNAYMKLADMFIDIIDRINTREGGYEIRAKGKDGIERIRWKDVFISPEDRLIQKYPTNLLPNQPSGRLDKAIELTQAGFLTKEESMSLLDYPDIKSITSLKTAKLDDIMLTIDLMINEGKKQVPQAYQNLELGIEWMQANYLKYRHRGVPERNLNLLLEWIDQAGLMLAEAKMREAEAQLAAMPAPVAPPGTPNIMPSGGEQVNPSQAKMIENFGQPTI